MEQSQHTESTRDNKVTSNCFGVADKRALANAVAKWDLTVNVIVLVVSAVLIASGGFPLIVILPINIGGIVAGWKLYKSTDESIADSVRNNYVNQWKRYNVIVLFALSLVVSVCLMILFALAISGGSGYSAKKITITTIVSILLIICFLALFWNRFYLHRNIDSYVTWRDASVMMMTAI